MTRKLEYSFVKQQLANSGCILLSTSYKRSDDKLVYMCGCGNKSKITWDGFKQGCRCMHCAGIKKRNATKGKLRPNARSSSRLSYDSVKKRFMDLNCVLLTDKYQNNKQKLTFICSCGRIGSTCLNSFQSDKQRCKHCGFIRRSIASKKSRLKKIFPKKDTSIEITLQHKLVQLGINFEKHKPIVGQPDLFIAPNICIFADGCYWHKCEKCGFGIGREHDKLVTSELEKQGYEVLRFWEHDINNNLDSCVNEILKWKGELKNE